MTFQKKILILGIIVGGLLCNQLINCVFTPNQIFSKDCPLRSHFSTPQSCFKLIFDTFNVYLRGKLPEQWQSKLHISEIEKNRQIELLGYDPAIEIVNDQEEYSGYPTLYFHGWQDTKNSAKMLKKYCGVIPGDVVLFNFPDVRFNFPFFPKLKKTFFGQGSEILSALYVLNYVINEKNLRGIHLFGASRGAATIINMLALLNNDERYKEYEIELKRIGISEQARKKILEVIQEGTIALEIPLRSIKQTLIPAWLMQQITGYKSDGFEPIDSIPLLKGLKLNILVHFQHADWVVLEKGEDEYFKKLNEANKDGKTYLVLGNDGGHVHTHTALSKAMTIFREHYKKSNDVKIIKESADIIENGKLVQFDDSKLVSEALSFYHKRESKIDRIYRAKTMLTGFSVAFTGFCLKQFFYNK